MPDVPLSDTCVCGVVYWHKMVGDKLFWCRRCGAIRVVLETHWQIPLDRAGDIARSVPLDSDETPTRPGTPGAKRRE